MTFYRQKKTCGGQKLMVSVSFWKCSCKSIWSIDYRGKLHRSPWSSLQVACQPLRRKWMAHNKKKCAPKMGYQCIKSDLSLRKHIKNREPIVCHTQKSDWGSKLRPNPDPWTITHSSWWRFSHQMVWFLNWSRPWSKHLFCSPIQPVEVEPNRSKVRESFTGKPGLTL